MITGAAAAFLETHRHELNLELRRTAHRYRGFDAGRALALLEAVLPRLGDHEPGADELRRSVFELVLLHVGREALSRHPALERLLCEVLPQLRRLLLERPASLPHSLSNAVENLGASGSAFCDVLLELGAHVSTADELLEGGALAAWRLGEARLRTAALEAARALSPGAVLIALGLRDWPLCASKLALALLAADSWSAPGERLSPATLAALRDGTRVPSQLETALAIAKQPPVPAWTEARTLGDFAGFGGAFAVPPVLLERGQRHCLYLRSGSSVYCLHADVFGCVVSEATAPASTGVATSPIEHPALRDATSALVLPGLIAFTTGLSHRVRLLLPPPGVL